MNIANRVKKYFPDATQVDGDEFSCSWYVGDREYYVSAWRISASEGNEDWSTVGVTLDDVLEDAAKGDWSDRGFMLQSDTSSNEKLAEEGIHLQSKER